MPTLALKPIVFTSRRFGARLYPAYGKRVLDVLLTLSLAPIWLPLCTLLWGIAKLDCGSGLFADTRIGKGGRLFTCWKIRTLPMHAPTFRLTDKLCADPRATAVGRFLRRASLDELPQFWCVLRGEMSLVGPRPVPRSELHRYGNHRAQYLSARPGMTGLWQVSGRNAVSYDDRVALDLRYLADVRVFRDLYLLWRTVREIAFLTGR